MTSKQSSPSLIEWLNDALQQSIDDIADNAGSNINSYGSGYDMGRRDALESVLSYLNGCDP